MNNEQNLISYWAKVR